MNLGYKILWFEDQRSWLNSMLPYVREFLDEKGFNLELNVQTDDSEVETLMKRPDFDLILMDYNLTGDKKGDTIIEYIRYNQVYTDIIFYSQKGEQAVRESIKDKQVDGVYCASRENWEFREKIKKVIETTIKKVEDINNMRGLVMAQASELDYKMTGIIWEFINCSSEHKEYIEEYIYQITHKSLSSNLNKCQRCKDNACIEELINHPIFDTDKKRRTVSKILELINCSELSACKDCMDTFENEIQTIRNILAHVKEDVDENGERILRSKVRGYEEVKFNDEKYIEIRKNVKRHKKNLGEIYDYINELKSQKEEVASALSK